MPPMIETQEQVYFSMIVGQWVCAFLLIGCAVFAFLFILGAFSAWMKRKKHPIYSEPDLAELNRLCADVNPLRQREEMYPHAPVVSASDGLRAPHTCPHCGGGRFYMVFTRPGGLTNCVECRKKGIRV